MTNILSKVADLPKRQKRFCEYLMEDYRDIPLLSVHELAERSGTSATTILRVLQTLGYKVYKDFQSDVQQFLLMEQPVVFSRFGPYKASGKPDSFSYILGNACDDIQKNINNINAEMFPKAVDALCGARRIAFLGLRSSSFVAGYMYTMLSTFFDHCLLVQADGSEYIYEKLQFLGSNDVMLAVSMGGPNYTARTLDAIRYAKRRSIRVVLVTSEASNPAVTDADYILTAHPSRYISLVSAMAIADALVYEFFNRRKDADTGGELAETLIERGILLPHAEHT